MGMFGSLPFSLMQPQGMTPPAPAFAPSPAIPGMTQGTGLGGPLTMDSLGNSTTTAQPKKPGFNEPGGWAEKLGAIGDLLSRAGGGNGTGAYAALMQARQQQRKDQAAKYAPQHIGDSLIRLNPQTGQYETLWSPPSDPAKVSPDAQLAIDAGLAPGSDAYKSALLDALRHKGDPFITALLPGNRFYAGPQSGFAAALGGGQQPVPSAPVGKLTPIPGGAGSQAPRTFR